MPMMLRPHPAGDRDTWPRSRSTSTRNRAGNTATTITRWLELVVEKRAECVLSNSSAPASRAGGLTSGADFDAIQSGERGLAYIPLRIAPLRVAPDAGSGWMWAAGELAMTPPDSPGGTINLIQHRLLCPLVIASVEREVVLTTAPAPATRSDSIRNAGRTPFMIEHSGEVSGFTAENMVFSGDSAAIVVLTNQDALRPAASAIANRSRRFSSPPKTSSPTPHRAARAIFDGLQRGTIDRSLFT